MPGTLKPGGSKWPLKPPSQRGCGPVTLRVSNAANAASFWMVARLPPVLTHHHSPHLPTERAFANDPVCSLPPLTSNLTKLRLGSSSPRFSRPLVSYIIRHFALICLINTPDLSWPCRFSSRLFSPVAPPFHPLKGGPGRHQTKRGTSELIVRQYETLLPSSNSINTELSHCPRRRHPATTLDLCRIFLPTRYVFTSFSPASQSPSETRGAYLSLSCPSVLGAWGSSTRSRCVKQGDLLIDDHQPHG